MGTMSPAKAAAIADYERGLAEAATQFERWGTECLRAVWRHDRDTYDVLVRAAISDGGDMSAYEDPTDEQLEDLAAQLVEKLRAGGMASGCRH